MKANRSESENKVSKSTTEYIVLMQKLEEMGQLRQELIERNEKIADLECQLEEKSLILNNSRKTLKQEREKLKVQYIKIDSQ